MTRWRLVITAHWQNLVIAMMEVSKRSNTLVLSIYWLIRSKLSNDLFFFFFKSNHYVCVCVAICLCLDWIEDLSTLWRLLSMRQDIVTHTPTHSPGRNNFLTVSFVFPAGVGPLCILFSLPEPVRTQGSKPAGKRGCTLHVFTHWVKSLNSFRSYLPFQGGMTPTKSKSDGN